jgi:tetratricopeptide (TPR) repeat protein
MAVKRVSDSYAKGMQAFGSARRTPSSSAARTKSSQLTPASPEIRPAPEKPAIDEASTAKALDDIAAGIAQLHQRGAVSPESVPSVDYHAIISKTVATLDNSTVEARHAVYECARHVVGQNLSGDQNALSPVVIEQERLALNQAIDQVEADAHGAASVPPADLEKPPAITAAVLTPPTPRPLPEVSQFRGGALRLFGMIALICVALFGYWLSREKSPPASPPDHVTASLDASAAPAAETSPDRQATPVESQPPSNPDAGPAAAAPPAPSDQLATNALPAAFMPCGAETCSGTGGPSGASLRTAAPEASQRSWLATYGQVPPRATRAVPPASAPEGKTSATSGSFDRGLEQAKGGDPELAIRYFTDAIRANPNFSEGYLQRGNMRFKNGNADAAVADFNDAIRTDPRNAAAYKARGMVLLYGGNENAALDDLTRAIQIGEADPARLTALEMFFARRSRAAMYARRQSDERELFDLSAMVDAYWKNPDLADAMKVNYGNQGASAVIASIYRQRAALYQQRANIDGAVADLSMASQLDPTRAALFIAERARWQEAASRKEQALADYKRVLALNPRHEEARQAVLRLTAQP